MNLKSYYHLKKAGFAINPRDDASVYFGNQTLPEDLRDRLETNFNQPREVPKLGIYGPFGAGKTHTLHHIAYVLATELAEDYPSETFHLDLSPIKGKESWRKVHADLINAIGRDRIKQAINAVLTEPEAARDPAEHLRARGILKYGERAIQNSQAHVFRALLFGGPLEGAAHSWLKGGSVTAANAANLEIETTLTDTSHLIAALLNVASMLHAGLGRRPILLIDEAEALRSLQNSDSIDEFITAFRKLADDDNNQLGLIIAFHNEGGMEDAPEVLVHDAVFRRFGYNHGFFDLSQIIREVDDIRTFMTQVLEYVIDQDAAQQTIDDHQLDVPREFFPFTEGAVDRLAQFVLEDPRHQVPSQILHQMGEAVQKGWRHSGKGNSERYQLVDEEIIELSLFPEQA
jgi:AAA domain